MAHIYSEEVAERAVSRDSLETRLELNRKSSSVDFTTWLMARLAVQPGEHILDVGCGTGAQALPFLQQCGTTGRVCALDISADSVATLQQRAANDTRLTAVVSDMAELPQRLRDTFPQQQFDLAHSSYALYYSPDRLNVLETMRQTLRPHGRLAVFTPNKPHGMVDFARQYSPIPAEVDDCMVFGPAVLEPWFRQHFLDVTVHFFHNDVSVLAVEDFVTFYRATTYYDALAEPTLSQLVADTIARDGVFRYEKNGYLIIGRELR